MAFGDRKFKVWPGCPRPADATPATRALRRVADLLPESKRGEPGWLSEARLEVEEALWDSEKVCGRPVFLHGLCASCWRAQTFNERVLNEQLEAME